MHPVVRSEPVTIRPTQSIPPSSRIPFTFPSLLTKPNQPASQSTNQTQPTDLDQQWLNIDISNLNFLPSRHERHTVSEEQFLEPDKSPRFRFINATTKASTPIAAPAAADAVLKDSDKWNYCYAISVILYI